MKDRENFTDTMVGTARVVTAQFFPPSSEKRANSCVMADVTQHQKKKTHDENNTVVKFIARLKDDC